MGATSFFRLARPIALAELAAVAGALIHRVDAAEGATAIVTGVAPLEWARPGDLAFFDNPRYAAALAICRASACLLREAHLALLPPGVVGLVTADPHGAMTKAMAHLFPDALRPGSLFAASGVSPGALVHPEARLEVGVTVDPGAVIGPPRRDRLWNDRRSSRRDRAGRAHRP